MKLPRWLRRLLGLALDWGVDKLGEAVNAPPVRKPGPDVKPITDADRGRPPRHRTIPPPRPLGHDEKTPAETPRAKRRP